MMLHYFCDMRNRYSCRWSVFNYEEWKLNGTQYKQFPIQYIIFTWVCSYVSRWVNRIYTKTFMFWNTQPESADFQNDWKNPKFGTVVCYGQKLS